MKKISPALQTIYADLVQQVYSSTVRAGSVYTQTVKGIKYLYARRQVGSERVDVFIGPADDLTARTTAEQIRREQANAKERRRTVSVLRRGGVPAPTTELGRVLDTIADAGLFSEAVLVGTAAYQCYSPIIGVNLPSAMLMTQDADLATASLAIGADGEGATMLDILQQADKSFVPVPPLKKGAPSSAFKNENGFMVDLLTPTKRRSDRNPVPLKNLEAGAVPLQHLDWLIEEPVSAVALYGTGVAVRVPQPAKYAVHKLIVAQKRGQHERLKRQKDLLQANALIEALVETDPYAIRDALEDACAKGAKGWNQPVTRSLKELGLEVGLPPGATPFLPHLGKK